MAFKPFANLVELEERAKPYLTESVYGYYASGAESETTLKDNQAALARWRLLPRVLVDVSAVDTGCNLLGRMLSSPVLVAPMAMQRLCHPDGELAVARAAVATGTGMILSTMATSSIEEVAAATASASPAAAVPSQQQQLRRPAGGAAGTAGDAAGGVPQGHLWFQIYVLTRRDVTELMVREAEALGYTALVVTVDAPRLGKRDRDERSKFTLPPGLSLKNLEKITRAAAHTQQEEQQTAGKGEGAGVAEGSPFGRHFSKLIDDSLTWEFVGWLKSATRLPVLLKGILAPSDARRAVELGVNGIIVSNHGGRQLDCTPAAIDLLPHVVRAVQGRVPILVDGGIRRGTDVVKCLALGAAAVLVGRPVLWALALGGQAGVESALELLRREVELSMALLGCRHLGEITEDFVVPPTGGLLQLPRSRL